MTDFIAEEIILKGAVLFNCIGGCAEPFILACTSEYHGTDQSLVVHYRHFEKDNQLYEKCDVYERGVKFNCPKTTSTTTTTTKTTTSMKVKGQKTTRRRKNIAREKQKQRMTKASRRKRKIQNDYKEPFNCLRFHSLYSKEFCREMNLCNCFSTFTGRIFIYSVNNESMQSFLFIS